MLRAYTLQFLLQFSLFAIYISQTSLEICWHSELIDAGSHDSNLALSMTNLKKSYNILDCIQFGMSSALKGLLEIGI